MRWTNHVPRGRYVAIRRDDGTGDWEHRLVAEQALGKPLPAGAVVHHGDGHGRNNAGGNLVICQDQAYHLFLEQRTRVLRAGGNPNTDLMCSRCRQPKPRTEFYFRKAGKFAWQIGQPLGYCKQCNVAKLREWRRNRKQPNRGGVCVA